MSPLWLLSASEKLSSLFVKVNIFCWACTTSSVWSQSNPCGINSWPSCRFVNHVIFIAVAVKHQMTCGIAKKEKEKQQKPTLPWLWLLSPKGFILLFTSRYIVLNMCSVHCMCRTVHACQLNSSHIHICSILSTFNCAVTKMQETVLATRVHFPFTQCVSALTILLPLFTTEMNGSSTTFYCSL